MTVDEGDCFEDVFDIAMAPVFPLNGGDRGNIYVCQQLDGLIRYG